MKFIFGNKVKIKDKIEFNYNISNTVIEKFKNQILTIESCEKNELGNWYKIVEDTIKFNWNENMLELVEDMFEDVEPENKFKIGQRVKIKRTGKIGTILEIDDEDYNKNYGYSNYPYRIRIDDCRLDFTVHDLEEVKEILEEKEKEYLGAVIKPFKKYVNYIEKRSDYNEKEFIIIVIKKEGDTEIIKLPFFEKGEMYKGMEIKKEYTLEELGL